MHSAHISMAIQWIKASQRAKSINEGIKQKRKLKCNFQSFRLYRRRKKKLKTQSNRNRIQSSVIIQFMNAFANEHRLRIDKSIIRLCWTRAHSHTLCHFVCANFSLDLQWLWVKKPKHDEGMNGWEFSASLFDWQGSEFICTSTNKSTTWSWIIQCDWTFRFRNQMNNKSKFLLFFLSLSQSMFHTLDTESVNDTWDIKPMVHRSDCPSNSSTFHLNY